MRYFSTLLIFFAYFLGCASPPRDSRPPVPAREADKTSRQIDSLDPVTGPVVAAVPDTMAEAGEEVPPTRFAPFIRRAETPAPALPEAANNCSLAVEVRDYAGLDGCGLLLETDAGVLLRVGNQPRGEPLEAGTRVSIGFELMREEDYEPSDCANEDAVIRVTCLRLLRVSSGLERPVLCESYDRPPRWLLDAAEMVAATYITRFPWKEGRFAYLLESPEGQYLYDCRGYLICRPRKNCLGFIEDFSEGVLIYEN